MKKIELCKCGSKLDINLCCNKYLSGTEQPSTCEELMRSRYTAFALNKMEYIVSTMCGDVVEKFNLPEAVEDNKQIKWLKLEIVKSESTDNSGIVEFNAYYRVDGKKYCMHEVSGFTKIDGRWFYTKAISLD